MNNLLLALSLLFPAGAWAAKAADESLAVLPAMGEAETAALAPQDPLQRPDAQKIMAELSQALKLSNRQEERLAKAVNRKSEEFDDNMEKYAKNSAEEKKWQAKMTMNRDAMTRINSGMPDLIREYLDDEQRQSYDEILAAKNKPAPAVEPAASGLDDGALQPKKKKRLVRRKKLAAGALPAGEEAGSVMVDKAPAPAGKKKRVLRKKAAAPSPEADLPSEPAGAAPTGKEAPVEEEDAGSYP